jgi:hypothetical protein
MDWTRPPTAGAHSFYRAVSDLIDAHAEAQHWTLEDVCKGRSLILVDVLSEIFAGSAQSLPEIRAHLTRILRSTTDMAAIQCAAKRQHGPRPKGGYPWETP